jgi:hypothetical protein
MDDEPLRQACHGGSGLLAKHLQLDYEEYLRMCESIRIAEATLVAKRNHTRIRRREFGLARSHLVLALMDAG